MKITPINTDTAAFAEAYRSCSHDLCTARSTSLPNPNTIDYSWYRDERIHALGVVQNHSIVAFVLYTEQSFFIDGSRGEILDLWVHAQKRRQGIALDIVGVIMKRVPGCIGIQVHRDNHSAHVFWARACEINGRSMIAVTANMDYECIYHLAIHGGKNATDAQQGSELDAASRRQLP